MGAIDSGHWLLRRKYDVSGCSCTRASHRAQGSVPYGNGQGDGVYLYAIKCSLHCGHKVAQQEAQAHGANDPHGQEAV